MFQSCALRLVLRLLEKENPPGPGPGGKGKCSMTHELGIGLLFFVLKYLVLKHNEIIPAMKLSNMDAFRTARVIRPERCNFAFGFGSPAASRGPECDQVPYLYILNVNSHDV